MKTERKIDAIAYIFVLAIVYMCYGVVAPLFFGDTREDWVSCPVTQAFTIVEDGDSEKVGRRVIQAKCDVHGLNGRFDHILAENFDRIANEYRGLRKGDIITCVAKWPTAARFPFQFWEAGQEFAPFITGICRPPSRLWLK